MESSRLAARDHEAIGPKPRRRVIPCRRTQRHDEQCAIADYTIAPQAGQHTSPDLHGSGALLAPLRACLAGILAGIAEGAGGARGMVH